MSDGVRDWYLEFGNHWMFDVGRWVLDVFSIGQSAMASRKNDDGTTAFVTVVPGFTGLAFVIDNKDQRRTLTFRDAQHEYVFQRDEVVMECVTSLRKLWSEPLDPLISKTFTGFFT